MRWTVGALCLVGLAAACKTGGTPRGPASNVQSEEPLPAADAQPQPPGWPGRPIVIVSGWGGRAVSYGPFLSFLREAGVAEGQVDVIYYPFMGSFEASAADVGQQLAALFDGKYRDAPRLDVYGVSTGHFVGLYALMKGGWADRVQKYVGIVGVGHGIVSAHIPTPLRAVDCPGFLCGGTLGRLTPFNTANALISAFYRQYHDGIDGLEKCSVFAAAANDGVITPADSGRFDGPYDTAATGGAFAPQRATSVAVAGMTHLTSITDRRYFAELVRGCYGAAWPLPESWGGAAP